MDFLSHNLGVARDNKIINGVKVSRNIHITHVIFVDDIIFGGMDNHVEWGAIQQIIKTFSETLDLYMRKSKSILIINDREDPCCRDICNIFGVTMI